MDEKLLDNEFCVAEGRTDALSEEQFRALRMSGIGGSEAGPLMGLSNYDTPMTVVARKLGLVKGFDGNDATKRGKRLEPAVREFFARWYEEETGEAIKVYSSPWFYRSRRYPWMTLNIDGLIEHPRLGLCNFEIKTANERQEEHWEDDSVPDTYYAQGQHYAAGTGLRWTIYGALVGLNLVIRHVEANEEFQTRMIETERTIWTDYVQKGLLPAPVGHDGEDEVLLEMYSSDQEKVVDLSAMSDKAHQYVLLSSDIKSLEAQKKAIAQEVKLALGDAKYAAMGAYKGTWSRFKTSRFDKDAFAKAHPDLLAEYTREEDSGRFTITASK